MLRTIAICTVCALAVVSSDANDRVTYRPSKTSSPVTLVGDIEDYTGEILRFRPLRGALTQIPTSDIVEVKTFYDPDHLRGIELYQSGQTQEAVAAFEKALAREPRSWVDREILAWLVRSAMRQEDQASAIQYFRQIVINDPKTRHWGLAPLVWAPTSISDRAKQIAKPMLLNGRPEEQLIAASVLLFDSVSGKTAASQMSQLASETNQNVSGLAKAQLWRIELAENRVSQTILENWKSSVARLDESLRSGPQYLIGRGYAQTGELRLAAAEWLWLPLIYFEGEGLTARATLEAAEAIEQTGLTQEADLLYRELMTRFPLSSEAAEVRQRFAAPETLPSPASDSSPQNTTP